MKREPCKPCARAQEYYGFLKSKVKAKAQNEQRSYAIWFDDEDRKYYSKPLSEAQDYYGYNRFEIVSKYS